MVIPGVMICFFQKEKDDLEGIMNKPLSPRRKSPEKKNVASLQVGNISWLSNRK